VRCSEVGEKTLVAGGGRKVQQGFGERASRDARILEMASTVTLGDPMPMSICGRSESEGLFEEQFFLALHDFGRVG
jgi:hypothetical protein